MSKMLVDRAVVEQALHVATAAGYPVALIAALKAALAEPVQEPDPWGAGFEAGYAAGVAEYDPQQAQQALEEADRIMGHEDEATEWRERWGHLFGGPPPRPAEPVQEPVYNDLLRLVGNLFDEAYKAGKAAAMAQPQEPVPVGHLVSPYGEFKPNFNLRFAFPPESLDWSIPLYYHAPPQHPAEPVQEPYTGDVTRIMRDAGMTFHLGLSHKAVVEQMTRVIDLVYAEASIKAAQQFAAAPPRRPAEPVGVVTSMVKGGVTWRRWPADMPDGTRLFSEAQP